jgi:hypothetical protein
MYIKTLFEYRFVVDYSATTMNFTSLSVSSPKSSPSLISRMILDFCWLTIPVADSNFSMAIFIGAPKSVPALGTKLVFKVLINKLKALWS